MPSFDLFRVFDRDLQVSKKWAVSGRHYSQTANVWLKRLDANAIRPLFAKTYGTSATRWYNRWRLFYLCVAEFFATREGKEWFVGHYLLQPKSWTNGHDIPRPVSLTARICDLVF